MDFSIKGNIIIQTKNEISELLGKHKFDLKGWYSNKLGQWWKIIKVLGLNWNARKDELSVNASQLHSNKAFTKRIVLSIIAGRWEPIGDSYWIYYKRTVDIPILRLRLKAD